MGNAHSSNDDHHHRQSKRGSGIEIKGLKSQQKAENRTTADSKEIPRTASGSEISEKKFIQLVPIEKLAKVF